MDIKTLRNILIKTKKYPGTKTVSPANVCNNGFPGNFNLSFTENEILNEFGQYIDIDHNFIYSKIQPVIRYDDFVENIIKQNENSYRYLGIFDLADVGGSISLMDKNKKEEISEFSIDSICSLLFNELGLDKKNLRISYFGGGNVTNVTQGKYILDYELPADESISYWTKHGIGDNQFIADYSRDTFLSLNIYGNHTPWGYRHEINYLYNGKLIDIATFERLDYRAIFSKDEILEEILPWQHSWSISAVGVERLLMIINGVNNITDLPHIKPLKDYIHKIAKVKNENSVTATTEALRVIHRVIADCKSYSSLGRRRREKFRTYCNTALGGFDELKIDFNQSNVMDLFSLNAKLQTYYPELKNSIKQATVELLEAQQRFRLDKSIKYRGVAQ
ncbi:MAG: hypothetical protein WCV92_00880 [Candidatus Buchananbacteria bacterium]